MRKLNILFDNNQKWVERNTSVDENYFLRMSKEQKPSYLWIGCSDSRIPANEVVGLEPGELFVHRNVANLFVPSDLNCVSVLQYAIDVLKIEHVIVCGHYGCGGIAAAMGNQEFGIMDEWLAYIRQVYQRSQAELDSIANLTMRSNRLVELNVLEQVRNVCHSSIARNAWERNQPLCVHGWIYDLSTGKLRDLNCCVSSLDEAELL
jgi:carbonic anhydrase